LKYDYSYNLDVRTSAHRPTVQVGHHYSVHCASVSKETKTKQTVKLTLHHRTST